jgi:hypothetical protein
MKHPMAARITPPTISACLPTAAPKPLPTITPIVNHYQRRQADRCRSRKNIDFDKGEAGTHRHCVDAGSEPRDCQQPKRMRTRLLGFSIQRGETCLDHPRAKHK